jgi:acyl carrier protein
MGGTMTEKEIFEKIVDIVSAYAKNKEKLARANGEMSFLSDLEVNSSRLVDVIIAMEDTFDIQISDEDAEKVMTLGDAVTIIKSKL